MVLVGYQFLLRHLHVAGFPIGEEVGGRHLILFEVEVRVVELVYGVMRLGMHVLKLGVLGWFLLGLGFGLNSIVSHNVEGDTVVSTV